MNWHEPIERLVRQHRSPDVLDLLFTTRHDAIVAADDPLIGWRLIELERDRLVDLLGGLAADIESRVAFAEREPGAELVLPDTNVFLEFKQLDNLKWPELAKASAVRLIIVGGVVDELDQWKYRADRAARAERARMALRKIDEWVAAGRPIRDKTTLDMLIDPYQSLRQTDADAQIRLEALDLKALVGRQVSVATGDYGMRDKARALGLGVVMLDQKKHGRSRAV
jgi:rRNA-processing protein FCF1